MCRKVRCDVFLTPGYYVRSTAVLVFFCVCVHRFCSPIQVAEGFALNGTLNKQWSQGCRPLPPPSAQAFIMSRRLCRAEGSVFLRTARQFLSMFPNFPLRSYYFEVIFSVVCFPTGEGLQK